MKRPRLTYATTVSPREAAKILGVGARTIRRWRGEALHPDPSQRRTRYDRAEVEWLAAVRRLQDDPSSPAPTLPSPTVDRPSSPTAVATSGPKVSRAFAMLREGQTIAQVCEELELEIEEADKLRKKYVAMGGKLPTLPPRSKHRPPTPRPRFVEVTEGPDVEAWLREMEEKNLADERNRWAFDEGEDLNRLPLIRPDDAHPQR